jgi:hypothetical protein
MAEETMSGERIDLAKENEAAKAEVPAPTPSDDVLNPSEYVEMFHPDNPTNSNGEPGYSTVSRSAFETVWRGKGWALRPDPYAPTPEDSRPQEIEEVGAAHSDESGQPQSVVEAPTDKE